MNQSDLVERICVEALSAVHCPCGASLARAFSVAEMGLVRRVEIVDRAVEIDLQLTEPTCLLAPSLAERVRAAILAIDPCFDVVRVSFVDDFEHLWDESQMAPQARERLKQIRSEDPVIPKAQ